MPSKNTIREFVADSIYHCYNRGVERRVIFVEDIDYGVFLNRLKQMLSDPNSDDNKDDIDRLRSFYGDVELLAYCLMPNHYHLLLYQRREDAISEFMQTLSTSYTMYFNKKYERVGTLFQGKYRARHIKDTIDWQHIARYIHLNPYKICNSVEEYAYSSMQFHKTPQTKPQWLVNARIVEQYRDYAAYRDFVMSYADPQRLERIEELHALD